MEYFAEAISLPEEIGTAVSFCISQGFIYVLGNGAGEETLIRWNPEDKAWEGLDVLPADYVARFVASGEEDGVYTLMQSKSGAFCSCRIDNSGASTITELPFSSETAIQGFYAYEKGLLLWTASAVSLFDAETGKQIRSRELDGMSNLSAISASGDTLYAQITRSDGQFLLPLEEVFSGESKHALRLESSAFVPLCVSGLGGQLVGLAEGLTRIDVEKNAAELVASWTNLKGVGGGMVRTIIERPDESIYYIDAYAGELICASPRLVQEKTTLVLATAEIEGPLNNVIRRFNESNPYYKVETQVYEYGTWDRLRVEIIAGQVPDMIDTVSLPLGGDYEMYLEDLLPYMERDPDLSENDFIPSVLEALKTNGKLFSVSPFFSLNAVIAYNGAQGEGLSFGEYEEAYREQPDIDPMRFIRSAESAFVEAFPVIENDVVIDAGSGYAVDTEALKGWLQFCREAPSLGIGQVSMAVGSLITSIREYAAKEADFIGWPAQRSSGYYVTTPEFCLGMFAASEHKDAAWSFIRFFFQNFYGNSSEGDALGVTFFPIIDEHFEANLQSMVNDKDHPLPERDAQRLRDIIYSLDVPSFRHEKLKDILLPLANAYFSGQRGLEETAGQMEERIRLYLAEQG